MEFPNKADGPKQLGPAPTPPKEKKAPVVSGAEQVKRPIVRRFFSFLSSESPKSMAAQVGREVLFPQFKMALEAAFNHFMAGMLWGDARNRPMNQMVNRPMLRNNSTPYNLMSAVQGTQIVPVQKSSGNYEDVVVRTAEEAHTLLASCLDYLAQYNLVCVGDLYEFAGIATSPSDNSYGWTSLSGAQISPYRGGFVLELPRPTLLR